MEVQALPGSTAHVCSLVEDEVRDAMSQADLDQQSAARSSSRWDPLMELYAFEKVLPWIRLPVVV